MSFEIPDVRILYTGLIAMHKHSPNRFDVGVHAKAGHTLIIGIIERYSDKMVIVETLDSDDLGEEVFLDVQSPQYPGVSIYTNGPFYRNTLFDDERDFRWTVEFDGKEFHDRPLRVNPEIFSPILYINNGIFYSAKKVWAEKVHPIGSAMANESKIQEVSWFIGTDIFFGETGSSATMKYGPGGANTFPFPKASDKKYLVLILNLARGGSASSKMDSDFQFYYDAFDVPLMEKFDLKGLLMSPASKATGRGSYSDKSLGEILTQLANAQGSDPLSDSAFIDIFARTIVGSYFRPCIPGRLSQSPISSRTDDSAKPGIE